LGPHSIGSACVTLGPPPNIKTIVGAWPSIRGGWGIALFGFGNSPLLMDDDVGCALNTISPQKKKKKEDETGHAHIHAVLPVKNKGISVFAGPCRLWLLGKNTTSVGDGRVG